MAGDPEFGSEVEPEEKPAIETPEQTPETEPSDETAIEEEGDLDELDFGFKKYRVPRDLKENVEKLRADATQKTEAASHRTREIEQREQRATEILKASEEELQHRAQLHHINSELKRFENFTWQQFQAARQTDPAGAEEAWAYVQHLRGEKLESESKISAAEKARNDAAQDEAVKRIEETERFARDNIKGWTPELNTKVLDFAAAEGIPKDFIVRNMSPKLYEILHLARIGREVQKQRAAPKPPAAPPEPLETVTARRNPPPAGLSDRLSTDEWMKRRNEQIAKKRA